MYHTYIFTPLYNTLIGIMDVLPWVDAGVAVILFTCLVKFVLFPLSKKAIISQIKMKQVEPMVAEAKEKYKGDQQLMGKKLMEIYKEHKVNPFSMILPLLIQLPIIYAMYAIFARSGLPVVNESLLYSFVHVPAIKVHFLGLIDITKKSIFVSLAAAASQYAYLEYTSRQQKKTQSSNSNTKAVAGMGADMSKMMSQMKYFFPVLIFIFSYNLSAAIGIYWTVSNLFTLAQDYWVRHSHNKKILKALK